MYVFAMQELKKKPNKIHKKPKNPQIKPNNKNLKQNQKLPQTQGAPMNQKQQFLSPFLKVYNHLQEQNQKLKLMKSPFTLCEVKAL